TVRDVIHCPDAPFNLISLGRLTDAGYKARFSGDTVEILSRIGTPLAVGDKINHMYRLRVRAPSQQTHAHSARSWDKWH
ncbi:hypothetical protein C8J57DRAFT_1032604, partial [Mycena rebaudengoi]